MYIFNPMTDYVKESTFPTAGEISALNSSSIDFIKKSTYYVQDFVCPFYSNGTFNTTYYGYILGKSQNCYLQYKIKSSIYTLSEIYGYGIPITTDATALEIYTRYGAVGEQSDVHTDSGEFVGISSPVAGRIYRTDISSAFTGISADDVVEIRITRNALDDYTQLIILGIQFKYTLT